ncbi:MAG: diaminopimelate epimerase, partial [Pseudomonadota bacterium]
ACATAIAAMQRGLVNREVKVSLPGGDLHIAWDAEDHIQMTGPATEAFRGTFEWADYS